MQNAENVPRPQAQSPVVLPGSPPEPCPELLTEREAYEGVGGEAEDRADQVNTDPLLDATAAASYLGLIGVVRHPAQAVRSLCRKRRIRSTRVAGKVMIRRSWLEQYISDNSRSVYGKTV